MTSPVLPAIVVPAFALAWWAACYLIGRDPARRAPQRAAAALVAYGIAVVLWTVEPDSAAAQILICVPALFWAGAAIGLHPERRYLDRGWLIASGVFLVVVIALPQTGRLVALAPLAGALVLLWRARAHVRPPMLPAAMAVATQWGFTFCTVLFRWIKTTDGQYRLFEDAERLNFGDP